MPPDRLTLRIICLHSPVDLCDDKDAVFGLQDKQQQLHSGITQADGSLLFECEVQVKFKNDAPDFAGVYVHGTVGKRFLYLSLGKQNNGAGNWIRRLKIPLTGITTTQLGNPLQALVDGHKSGTVELIGGGWTLWI